MNHTEGKMEFKGLHLEGTGSLTIGPKTVVKVWDHPEAKANAERIRDLWNAFNGISTHDAVNIIQVGLAMKELPDKIELYVRHGAEMHSTLKGLNDLKSYEGVRKLLDKLEVK